MKSAEYTNLFEKIARLEGLLLGGDGFFRCSECEEVFDTNDRDCELHECGCEACYVCAPRIRLRDEADDETYEYLRNHGND